MSELARLHRALVEERGNLRAAAVLLAVSGIAFALGIELAARYLVGFLLLPLAVAGGVFGVTCAIHAGWMCGHLRRTLRSMMRLPAARVIQR